MSGLLLPGETERLRTGNTAAPAEELRGLAGEDAAVGFHGVGFGIDLDFRQCVVEHHVALADFAAAFHRARAGAKGRAASGRFCWERGFADKGEAGRGERSAGGAKLRTVEGGLGRGNRGVGVAHVRPGDEAALEHQLGFDAEERGLEDDEVGELTDLEANRRGAGCRGRWRD